MKRDTTVSVDGRIYELEHGFLAGRVVDIVYSHLDEPIIPEVEHEGQRYPLHLVDPASNSRRRRLPRTPTGPVVATKVAFNPSGTTKPDVDGDISNIEG